MPRDPVQIRSALTRILEEYPEFRHCELENEVAMIYGWGNPMLAWQNYCELKEMLEHVASR